MAFFGSDWVPFQSDDLGTVGISGAMREDISKMVMSDETFDLTVGISSPMRQDLQRAGIIDDIPETK